MADTLINNRITAAKGLKSATTSIDVSAATAPTSGQVLTATASTTATWQTPSGGGVTVKCGYTTRTTGSTGTQTIAHGLGATPKYVQILAEVRNGNVGFAYSTGQFDGTTQTGITTTFYTSGQYDDNASDALVFIQIGTGKLFYTSSVSWDGTNITLTWDQAGSPTTAAPVKIQWFAIT